jgi:hypothetical protein
MCLLTNITQNAQIAFWAIASIIAVLTYIQARRTILQPFRTELFKKRLETMTDIMRLFLGKNELSLRSAFDFEKLFSVNAAALNDAYQTNVFHVRVDRDKQPYNLVDCPLLVEMTGMPWPEHNRLHVNREYCVMIERLNQFLENPILPRELVVLLEEYRGQAESNLDALIDTLVEAAKEMPKNYPSVEALANSSADDLTALEQSSRDWLFREVHNRWIHKFKHLSPITKKVNEFIRSYFDDKNLSREYGGALFRGRKPKGLKSGSKE